MSCSPQALAVLAATGCALGGVLFIPRRVIRTLIAVVLTARAGGVFPLGLGRQANGPAGLLAQPPAERHRIAAADDNGRMVVRRLEAGATPVEVALMRVQSGQRADVGPTCLLGVRLVPGRFRERAELADGDLGLADAEVVADLNPMDRPLVGIPGRRAHEESTRRDAHQLECDVAGLQGHKLGVCSIRGQKSRQQQQSATNHLDGLF